MNWQPAQPFNDLNQEPEVCLNLWWFRDVASGLVYRLAGRAYALTGTEEEKLACLRRLSRTDFHIAQNFEIPKRFTIVTNQGELAGVTDQTIVVNHHSDLFNHVFDGLERDLPTQMHSIENEPTAYKLKIPKQPLCCTTCVLEYEDGRLVPQISSKAS